MQIASLGSGSKGNATIISHENTTLMVDCGFSLRQFEQRLSRLDLSPHQIDAILLTHEHADHGSGVARLAAKFKFQYGALSAVRARYLKMDLITTSYAVESQYRSVVLKFCR